MGNAMGKFMRHDIHAVGKGLCIVNGKNLETGIITHIYRIIHRLSFRIYRILKKHKMNNKRNVEFYTKTQVFLTIFPIHRSELIPSVLSFFRTINRSCRMIREIPLLGTCLSIIIVVKYRL